uniref:Uncharacterized protein n=1 Tax=Schlesneria paludicola TaxID=360056 RepID=A0A7C2P1C8_9PLAN
MIPTGLPHSAGAADQEGSTTLLEAPGEATGHGFDGRDAHRWRILPVLARCNRHKSFHRSHAACSTNSFYIPYVSPVPLSENNGQSRTGLRKPAFGTPVIPSG